MLFNIMVPKMKQTHKILHIFKNIKIYPVHIPALYLRCTNTENIYQPCQTNMGGGRR